MATDHIPPDIYAKITKDRKIKKITHEEAQGSQEPKQGKAVGGHVGVRKTS